MNYRLLAVSSIVAVTIGYCSISSWYERNPLRMVRAEVESIEPFHYRSDVLSSGVRVELSGVEGVIRFSQSSWDPAVEEGDSVDAVVRASLKPGSDLTGHCIYPLEPPIVYKEAIRRIIPIEDICKQRR